jgi:hypothetical protein
VKRRIAIVAGAVVLASAVLLVWLDRSSDDRAPPPPPAVGTDNPRSGDTEAPAHPEPPSAANPEREQAAVPEPSVVQRIDTAVRSAVGLVAEPPPLAERIDELTRRADAGDAEAGCMLGLELMQCRERDTLRLTMAAWERRPPDREGWVQQMQKERAKLAWLEHHCAGVADTRIDETPQRIFAAADGGNGIAAGVAIAAGGMWVGARLTTAPELVAQMRDGFPRWVDLAFERGAPIFIEDLMQSARYGFATNLNMQALARDPVAMRAFDLFLVLSAADTGANHGDLPAIRLAHSDATLDPTAKARADALAARWYAAWRRMPRRDADDEPDPDDVRWLDLPQTPVSALHEACAHG